MPWLAIVTWLVMLFLFTPLVVAVVYAFSAVPSLTWPFHGWSLRWFETVVADRGFRNAFVTSTTIAIVAALIATVIGTMAALVFTRLRWAVTDGTQALARLPAMLPGLFLGIGFVSFMILTGITPGTHMIVAAHVIVAVPWVVLVIVSSLRTFDVELEAAARDLGAGPMQVLTRVTLPIVSPSILGAALLAFAFSFDETFITLFTAGQETTVPLYIIGKLRRVVDPTGNAVAVFLLAIPWLTFALAALLLRRSGGVGAILGRRW